MPVLVSLREAAGFEQARTYIASGNVAFRSTLSKAGVKLALEERLRAYAEKPVSVLVRSGEEIARAAALAAS